MLIGWGWDHLEDISVKLGKKTTIFFHDVHFNAFIFVYILYDLIHDEIIVKWYMYTTIGITGISKLDLVYTVKV